MLARLGWIVVLAVFLTNQLCGVQLTPFLHFKKLLMATLARNKFTCTIHDVNLEEKDVLNNFRLKLLAHWLTMRH